MGGGGSESFSGDQINRTLYLISAKIINVYWSKVADCVVMVVDDDGGEWSKWRVKSFVITDIHYSINHTWWVVVQWFVLLNFQLILKQLNWSIYCLDHISSRYISLKLRASIKDILPTITAAAAAAADPLIDLYPQTVQSRRTVRIAFILSLLGEWLSDWCPHILLFVSFDKCFTV